MKEFAQTHPAIFWLQVAATLVSLRIVLGLWLLHAHRKSSVAKRVVWSFIAFLPLAGPLFYGAFYRVPSVHNNALPPNSDAFSGGHGA